MDKDFVRVIFSGLCIGALSCVTLYFLLKDSSFDQFGTRNSEKLKTKQNHSANVVKGDNT